MRRLAAAFFVFACIGAVAPSAQAGCYRCEKPWYGGKLWTCADKSSGFLTCTLAYSGGTNTCTASGTGGSCQGLGGMEPEYPDVRLEPCAPQRLYLVHAETGRETAPPRLQLVAAEVAPVRSGS
jgi:hypothetical protein